MLRSELLDNPSPLRGAIRASPTGMRRCCRPIAIAFLVLLLGWGLATPPDPRGVPNGPIAGGTDDLTLFAAVTARVRHGEDYYAVMGEELATGGYPSGHVANWRTPIYLTLHALAPTALHVILIGIGVLVLAGTAQATRTAAPEVMIGALLLQIGVVAALWKPAVATMPEPLAGALIALSVLVALRGWRVTSVVLGTAALFIRELAAPYVGIRFLLAVYRREWREASGWALSLSAYALFILWHARHVYEAMPANASVHPISWIQFGGMRFVLATVRSNAWLTGLPWWLTPIALVTAIAGAMRSPLELRLPVFGYLAAFAVAGLPFNWYWGWVPGMLLPLAWANFAEGLLLHIRRQSIWLKVPAGNGAGPLVKFATLRRVWHRPPAILRSRRF